MARRLIQICHATVLVTRAALALRLRGFAPVAARLLRRPGGPASGQPGGGEISRAFLATSRLPWSTCLSRSVALARHLRQLGLPAQLRLGAHPEQPARPFQAHAWVELDGCLLLPDSGHQPLETPLEPPQVRA
ncbi:MAG: lasso peptide biosynthesis B2 protein [Pseudomonadota bacterium]